MSNLQIIDDSFIGKHIVYMFHDTINDLYYIGHKANYTHKYFGSPRCKSISNPKYLLQQKYLNCVKTDKSKIVKYVLHCFNEYNRTEVETIEKFYQEQYNVLSNNKFINASIATIRGSVKGWNHSEETKSKISNILLGKRFGWKHKDESIELMKNKRNSRKDQPMQNKKHSEEYKVHMKNLHYSSIKFFHGNHHTLESKKKISEKLSGENSYMYGIPKSEQIKRKISEYRKGKLAWNCKIEINNLVKYAKEWSSIYDTKLFNLISYLEISNINYKIINKNE